MTWNFRGLDVFKNTDGIIELIRPDEDDCQVEADCGMRGGGLEELSELLDGLVDVSGACEFDGAFVLGDGRFLSESRCRAETGHANEKPFESPGRIVMPVRGRSHFETARRLSQKNLPLKQKLVCCSVRDLEPGGFFASRA